MQHHLKDIVNLSVFLLGTSLLCGCSDGTGMQGASVGMGGPGPMGGAGGTGGSGQGGSGAGTGGVAGFSSQGDGTSRELEAHVAGNEAGTVVAVWMGASSATSTTAYNISHDGGLTWAGPRHIDSPDGRISSDPAVAFDAEGNAFVVWLGFRGSAGSEEIGRAHV